MKSEELLRLFNRPHQVRIPLRLVELFQACRDTLARRFVAVIEVAHADHAIVVEVGERQTETIFLVVESDEIISGDFSPFLFLRQLRSDDKDQANIFRCLPDQRHLRVGVGSKHRHQNPIDHPETGVQRNPINGHRPDRVVQTRLRAAWFG